MSADIDGDGLTNAVEQTGWCNASGCFQTNASDSDSDADGLTDGQEKLYETNPLNDQSPGIYVEYESNLNTRQYYSRDGFSPAGWGWQQYGDRYISMGAVVVRRGAAFSVGGPPDATIQVIPSIPSLTTLTPVRDTCGGRWRIAVPSNGTVGKYQILLQDGAWSKSLNLYVIFELPSPSSSFTQAMVDNFVYDDDPSNLRDERAVNLGDYRYEPTNPGYAWIPAEGWINAGSGYRFTLSQFEPYVFEDHVIEAINGRTSQWDAAFDLVARADKVTRFNYPRVLYSSQKVLYPPDGDDSNQCSNIAGLLTAFQRSAGIPARTFFTDWVENSFDHAAEIWLNGAWYSARGYRRAEDPGCGWNCEEGHLNPTTRSTWGRNTYKPWHSAGNGSGSTIMTIDETWNWSGVNWVDGEPGHEYRWPSWDWDAVVGKSWWDMQFVPYWTYWGWTQEPQIVGSPPNDWPAVTSFTLDVTPNSQVVTRTNSTSYTVSLNTSDGFSNRVRLSVSGLPGNTTSTFLPDNYCAPNCTRTLIVSTTAGTPLGNFYPTVMGTDSGLADRTETVELIVTDAMGATGASTATPPDLGALSTDDQSGLTVQGVRDYGLDTDGDGYFDQLVIDLEVTAAQPGSYWLRGQLGPDHYVPRLMGMGGLIVVAITQADLAAGANSVQLRFEGLRISAAKVDGPYLLKYLSITDVSDPEPNQFVTEALGQWNSIYTTAAYRAGQFQNQGALFSDRISEAVVDADGDGRFEALTLNIGLDIFKPGTYTVQGDLYNSEEQFVAQASWTGSGSTASLQFTELAGTTGPYVLKELELLNAAGEGIDYVYDAYTTQQVMQAEIKTHIMGQAELGEVGAEATLPGPYSDAGRDTDGDGLFDQLVITATLVIEPGEGGQPYRLEGWLVDANGGLASWATSQPQVLGEGTHNLALAFDGRVINERGVDGRFKLVALKALQGSAYTVLDEIDVAYTTAIYDHNDFEEPVLGPLAVSMFEDNMENGTSQWSASSPWSLATSAWYSYSHAWKAEATGSKNGTLTTVPLNLSGYADPALRFKTCYNMASANDMGYLQISTDGLQWTRVATFTNSTSHWSSQGVDLSGIGNTPTLKVRFEANSTTGLLWYVDDVYLSASPDTDGDGLGDRREDLNHNGNPADDDSDGDGIPDYMDPDDDGDGVLTKDEDVNQDGNPGNDDTDHDGKPNYVDSDDDGDGIPTSTEGLTTDSDADHVPDYLEPNNVDTDGDGKKNYQDADDDGDGVPTADEDPNDNDNPADDDTDGDTKPNYLDIDDDGDGDSTAIEGPTADDDGDGAPNYLEPDDEDIDNDGLKNEQDPDDDGDGVPSADEDWDHDGSPLDDDGNDDGIPDFLDPAVSEPPIHFNYLPVVIK
jgi:hypothetical protein